MKKLITNDFQVVYTKIQTIKRQKNFIDNKNRNFGKKNWQELSSLRLGWARTPKFGHNICKSIRLKVTENYINWVIQIDVVKKSTGGGGIPNNK